MPWIAGQFDFPCCPLLLMLCCGWGPAAEPLTHIFCLPRNEMASGAWPWPEEEVVAAGTGALEHLGACRRSPTRCQLISVALS